jgi:hypothetical protein
MFDSLTTPSVLTNEQIVSNASAAGAIKPHQDVSDKYSFVPTLKAVDLLRADGWLPVSARQSGTRKDARQGFQKHTIRFMKNGLVFSDQERVDLVMVNSHDRGCAFHLMASVWRKICGNGLMVSTDLLNFSHKHIGFDAEAFMSSAKLIAGQAGAVADQVEGYKAIELAPNEKGIYATSVHKLVYDETEEAPIRPDQLLQERRYDDKGDDLWNVFNVAQENILKGGLRGHQRDANNRIRRVRTRPVKSIDRDIKLNRALWTLTEKMAELKLKNAN